MIATLIVFCISHEWSNSPSLSLRYFSFSLSFDLTSRFTSTCKTSQPIYLNYWRPLAVASIYYNTCTIPLVKNQIILFQSQIISLNLQKVLCNLPCELTHLFGMWRHSYILVRIIYWQFQLMYVDILISNVFNLNKHFFFLSFFLFTTQWCKGCRQKVHSLLAL